MKKFKNVNARAWNELNSDEQCLLGPKETYEREIAEIFELIRIHNEKVEAERNTLMDKVKSMPHFCLDDLRLTTEAHNEE